MTLAPSTGAPLYFTVTVTGAVGFAPAGSALPQPRNSHGKATALKTKIREPNDMESLLDSTVRWTD
jgi:hypothetical protein